MKKLSGYFLILKVGSVRIVWNIEKAKKAGLYKPDSGWIKYPAPMMRARCTTEGVNVVNPGCKIGMYTPEEISDFDDKPGKRYKDVTPVEKEYVASLIDTNPPIVVNAETSKIMKTEFEYKIDLCQNMSELSDVKSEVVTNKKYMVDNEYEELKARIYAKKDLLQPLPIDVKRESNNNEPTYEPTLTDKLAENPNYLHDLDSIYK